MFLPQLLILVKFDIGNLHTLLASNFFIKIGVVKPHFSHKLKLICLYFLYILRNLERIQHTHIHKTDLMIMYLKHIQFKPLCVQKCKWICIPTFRFQGRSQNCEKQKQLCLIYPSVCLFSCLSLCLSVRRSAWNDRASTEQIFMKFGILMLFKNLWA